MKDKKREEASIILATPESSEIVEDSPRFHHAANRFIPTDKDPIKEINNELRSIDSIAPEKNCTCQQEETHAQKTDKPSATSSTVECTLTKPSAGQEVGSSAGSCSSATGDQA